MSLPRQQFGHLQSRLFPRFFALQSLSALALLGLYSRRPGGGELVRTFWRHGNKTVWALVVMASSGFANWLFVGPLTTGAWPLASSAFSSGALTRSIRIRRHEAAAPQGAPRGKVLQ